MLEFVSIVLNALLSGGLVVTLVTIRSIKRKARSEAKSVEIDNAEKLLENFESYIVKPLKTEVSELRNSIENLREAVKQIQNCPHADSCPVSEHLHRLHTKERSGEGGRSLPSPAEPEEW